ncbi:uncharacterized protein LOC144550566 [Carex rostrata]
MDPFSTGEAISTKGGSMMLWHAEQMAQWERQVERRQLFLKSYQFSAPSPAPHTLSKRLGRSLVQARRLVWTRLRRLPRVVWSTLRRRSGARKWARLVVLPKGNGYYRSRPVFECFC